MHLIKKPILTFQYNIGKKKNKNNNIIRDYYRDDSGNVTKNITSVVLEPCTFEKF